jgi:hypothetical protein
MNTGRWTDLAPWRGPTRNEGDGDGTPGETADQLIEVRGLVLHIAEGYFEGTISYERNPASQVSSHFVAGRAGGRAQIVDVGDRAWTQIEGNSRWLSVECEGFTTGNRLHQPGWEKLTAAQIEFCAQLLAEIHRRYGVPLQVATAPSGRGLGHHSMGAENGVNWGHSDCPGPPIIAQKPAIVARAIAIIEGADMDLTPENLDAITHRLLFGRDLPATNPTMSVGTALLGASNHAISADSKLDGLAVKIDALAAAVHALAAGGTSVDTAAVIAAVNAVGDRETQAVASLRIQLAAAQDAAAAAFRAAT